MKIFIVLIVCLSLVFSAAAKTPPGFIVFPLNATGETLTESQSNAAFVDASNLIVMIQQSLQKTPGWKYGLPVRTIRNEWAVPITKSAAPLVPSYPISFLTSQDFPQVQ